MTADADAEPGTEDEGTEFDAAGKDELKRLPAATGNDKSITERIGNQHVKALKRAHKHRGKMVTWTLRTVGGLSIASTGFMGLYIWSQWHHVEAAVIMAYFASVVTETIGILYVIARYLFPTSGLESIPSGHGRTG